jgi:hypothetical protein
MYIQINVSLRMYNQFIHLFSRFYLQDVSHDFPQLTPASTKKLQKPYLLTLCMRQCG